MVDGCGGRGGEREREGGRVMVVSMDLNVRPVAEAVRNLL
jgi:hypothetical protein